jgi:predicted amidohydrolase YtcJ
MRAGITCSNPVGMRSLFIMLLLVCSVLAQPADLVFKGGQVYTMDASRSWAQAVAVKEGRIVYVGTDTGVQSWIGPGTEVVDLVGKMLLPGFHDSHVHPASGGLELLQCDLNQARSSEEVFQRIADYSAKHKNLDWIVGGGWQMPIFPAGQPNREQLDRLIPDRPAFITSSDAHTAWVNSKALESANIDAGTPDPPGGEIDRDLDGRPTGLLREEAITLVSQNLPPTTDQEYRRGLLAGLELANTHGITSLVDANATAPILKAYQRLSAEGRLSARVVTALFTDPKQGSEQVQALQALRDSVQDPLIRATSAKVYADGVIEAHTAALLEPYLDTGQRGITIWSEDRYRDLISELEKAGFQIHVHAIGDRAVRLTLDSFQESREQNENVDLRHQIAHLQLVSPTDIPRFRELGVVANFQPLWAYNDTFIRDLTVPVLGPERSRLLYTLKSFHEQGVTVVGGSDWSVTSINPLEAIQVGMTRTDPDQPSAAPLLPEQALELSDLLAAYTINGAYGMHQAEETGSIEVGKWADLIVLDRNLFEVLPREIGKVRVLQTILGGQTVFRSDV